MPRTAHQVLVLRDLLWRATSLNLLQHCVNHPRGMVVDIRLRKQKLVALLDEQDPVDGDRSVGVGDIVFGAEVVDEEG